MKIAFFTDTFYPEINGVAKTLKRLTDYLEEQNIEVKVFAPSAINNEYASTNIQRFKSLPFFLYPECRLAFPNVFHIKTELQKFSPDLIHVATPFNMGLCGVYYAKKLNIPLVGSYHTDFNYYLQYYDLDFLSKYLWKYMNWFHRPFKKTFVPTNETLEQLKREGFMNLEIWPRGVDASLYHPYYDKLTVRQKYGIRKKYLLLYVGRLAPEKDVGKLLEIAKLLPNEINEQVQWLIVGDGPMRTQLQNHAQPNMLFTGFLKGEELAELYSTAELFVFPSPTETFGNVVLESLASGTPVIGTNSGGVKNIIQNNTTGYLCKMGDAQDFANSITYLLNKHSLRRQMGFEGRHYALSQKWDKIFDELLFHYADVIDEPKKQRYA